MNERKERERDEGGKEKERERGVRSLECFGAE